MFAYHFKSSFVGLWGVQFLVACTLFLFSSFGMANDLSRCQSFYEDLNSKWTLKERRVQWIEPNSDGKFYAVAYVTEFGMLYLNMRLVSEDGAERAVGMNGKKFIEKAIAYFKETGVHIAGIKGWWNLNRRHGPTSEPFEKQVQESGSESVNFKEYWVNRKVPNDPQAATKTWTYKMASRLGFTEVAKVAEFSPQWDLETVMVTFLPKVIDNTPIKRKLFGDKKEIEVILRENFLPSDSFIGTQEPAALALSTIFKLNLSQDMLIEIYTQKSQTASDLKLLGFNIVGVEKRPLYDKDGEFYSSEIVLRVRP